MIEIGTVLAIARAERRLTRRLARYWVATTLAALLTTMASATPPPSGAICASSRAR